MLSACNVRCLQLELWSVAQLIAAEPGNRASSEYCGQFQAYESNEVRNASEEADADSEKMTIWASVNVYIVNVYIYDRGNLKRHPFKCHITWRPTRHLLPSTLVRSPMRFPSYFTSLVLLSGLESVAGAIYTDPQLVSANEYDYIIVGGEHLQ